MSERDPKTAMLLAERMVGSFFTGLSTQERRAVLAGGAGVGAGNSPLFSLLSYTFDVYLDCVELPEEKARGFFALAVKKKLEEFRREAGLEVQSRGK
ncbi:MAG: hypothetical protein FVQ81_05600 [Candidatus Glassbacteria bacterium]|nr:hypothetical protein [Candidatus Glassbacteria bacterium]